MIREAIGTARTVDEAIDFACLELNIAREDAQFEIIDLPKKSLFKNVPAKVRVFIETDEPEPAPKAPPVRKESEAPREAAPAAREAAKPAVPQEPFVITEEMKEKAEFARQYVTDILVKMGLSDAQVTFTLDENGITLQLAGEGLGVIIGRRGETLDALQYLTGLSANRGEGTYVRVSIDSGDYRQKREKTLEALAGKLANTVARTGRSCTLEPMNPYERRIIHAAVSKVQGVSSASVGEEPNRKVVISSTTPRRPQGNRQGGGFNRNRPGGGGNRQGGGFNRNRQGGGQGGQGGNRPESGNRPEGGFNRDNRQGGNRPEGGFNRDNRQGGGFNRDNRQGGGYNRDNRQGGGFNRDSRPPMRDHSDGYNRPPQNDGPKVEKTQSPEESGTKLYSKIKLD